MSNVIEIERLDKFYGPFQALTDINLTVAQGEVVVILGPSGSGKSTLIRCINLLSPIKAAISGCPGSAWKPGPSLPAFAAKWAWSFRTSTSIHTLACWPTWRWRRYGCVG